MGKYLISLFTIMFFFVNILSISSFSADKYEFTELSLIERIFSNIQNPTDILSNRINKNRTDTTQNKSSKNKDNAKILDYVLPTTTINVLSFCQTYQIKNIIVFISNYIDTEIQYPIKIPFRSFVFLLLILKLIFNVLPRSISIICNRDYIERACIV